MPKEIKTAEHRVAMTPDGVREFERHGIDVFVETGAGEGASIYDDDYRAAGADIVPTAADAWAQQMVVKVKEPKEEEFGFLRPDLTLFTYLHLAAYPDVARALIAAGTTSIAYETVQLDNGALPLLAPMSEVAGRLAPQMGAHFLERHNGGRGVLMGGAPGVRPATVVVLGAGNVGWNAAWIAAGMEAEVVLIDKNLDRLRWVDQIHKGRIMTLASNRGAIERSVADADLVIGAVLVAGGRAPVVVSEDMVRGMKPQSVIVDVAIDQGGCIETIRETTHDEPVYEMHGVIHYAVGNMPGAVPHTSTYALTNATLPYQLDVALLGAGGAARQDPAIALGDQHRRRPRHQRARRRVPRLPRSSSRWQRSAADVRLRSYRSMCRNITELRGLEPPATAEEISAAARQYVRKVERVGDRPDRRHRSVRGRCQRGHGVDDPFARHPPAPPAATADRAAAAPPRSPGAHQGAGGRALTESPRRGLRLSPARRIEHSRRALIV